eukprot:Selendium_serpulae@DN6521_c4_g1_i15.p1
MRGASHADTSLPSSRQTSIDQVFGLVENDGDDGVEIVRTGSKARGLMSGDSPRVVQSEGVWSARDSKGRCWGNARRMGMNILQKICITPASAIYTAVVMTI